MAASATCSFMGRVLLVTLVLGLGGCSFLFSKPPSDEYRPRGDVDCSGYALPILDTMWAGLNGIGALRAASTDDATWRRQSQPYDRSLVMVVGVGWLVVSGLSAIHGYGNGAACAEAQEEAAALDERRRYLRSLPRRNAVPRPPAPSPPAVP